MMDDQLGLVRVGEGSGCIVRSPRKILDIAAVVELMDRHISAPSAYLYYQIMTSIIFYN